MRRSKFRRPCKVLIFNGGRYLIPTLLAALLFVIFRKQIKENADTTRVRYKKANKVAKRRLKIAYDSQLVLTRSHTTQRNASHRIARDAHM